MQRPEPDTSDDEPDDVDESGESGEEGHESGEEGHESREEAPSDQTPDPAPASAKRLRLVDAIRARMRLRHLAARTEKAYLHWMRRFFAFHGQRHPRDLGEAEMESFLSSLADGGRLSASTQSQALAALLFLYRHVLDRDVKRIEGVARAKRSRRLPVVMTRDETAALLGAMDGTPRLMATVMYGAGLRLLECCRLRVKDIGFSAHELSVRQGKGDRDRRSMLPHDLDAPLKQHLIRVRRQHELDVAAGAGWVQMPGALHRKMPQAGRTWPWQWVFPATRLHTCHDTGLRRRHHLHETVLQKAVRQAARDAGLTKRVTTHALRHSFATHLLTAGYDIRTIQELLGHSSVKTTMIYTHVLNRGYGAIRSPLDALNLPQPKRDGDE